MAKKKVDPEALEEAEGLKAYRYGALDFERGRSIRENPYREAFKVQSWAAGWYAAQTRSAETLRP